MGMEIGNEHQLPIFWEVKQEVFIFFPSAKKRKYKSKSISNWEMIRNLSKRLESILLKTYFC